MPKELTTFRHVSLVNGPGAHGKDQFIKYVLEYAASKGIAGHNFSSIDPCRQWSQEQYGYDPSDKSDLARRALVALKQAWIKRDRHGPNNYLLGEVDNVANGFVFLHVREPESIYELQEMGRQRGIAIETVHVIRPHFPIPDNEIDKGTLGPADKPFPYDLFIENAGTLAQLESVAHRYAIDRIPRLRRL